MEPPKTSSPERFLRIYRAPLLVLVLALAASGLAAWSVHLTSRARDQVRFLTSIRWTKDLIEQRLSIYTSVLESEAALFAVNEHPTAAEFRTYVERLGLQQSYPGIQGIGFARRTPADAASQLTQHMRREGIEDFVIRPRGSRPEYFPIVYLEPLDRRNREAIGYDMFSEPTRQEAMTRARDDGRPAASGKVQLVQEIDPIKQAGFLLYVPVYRGGQVPATAAERQEKLLGFAYSPFRADDFFEGIFGSERHPDLQIDVYDGNTTAAAALLHASHRKAAPRPWFERAPQLSFAGHTWTLQFQTTPEFEAASYRSVVPWVFGLGVLLSLVLCAITAALARAHDDLQKAQDDLKAHADSLERTVAIRTARLQETVSELEHMSYSMVHDMRAPLRAIQSFASLLEEQGSASLSHECRGYIERMKTAAARMDALIRDVLNYGKLVREELPLNRVEIPPLVRGIVETYPMFHNGRAEISVDPKIPPVLGNEGALTQCFSNLLSNSVKFAQPGQKPEVNVTAQQQDGWVHICIADKGMGIPKEMQNKLFQMFQRFNPTSEGGTGMGLAIVRKAAERMGGTVSVLSEPGQGTRVFLNLKSVR